MENIKFGNITVPNVVTKRFLIVLISTLIFAGAVIYIAKIQFTWRVLGFAILLTLIVMITGVAFGLKYPSFFTNNRKVSGVFFFLGGAGIIVETLLIILNKGYNMSNYLGLLVGLIFIFYGIYQIKKEF